MQNRRNEQLADSPAWLKRENRRRQRHHKLNSGKMICHLYPTWFGKLLPLQAPAQWCKVILLTTSYYSSTKRHNSLRSYYTGRPLPHICIRMNKDMYKSRFIYLVHVYLSVFFFTFYCVFNEMDFLYFPYLFPVSYILPCLVSPII